jgi:hypothetical protein
MSNVNDKSVANSSKNAVKPLQTWKSPQLPQTKAQSPCKSHCR